MRKSKQRIVLTVILASLAWFSICTLIINFYLSVNSPGIVKNVSVKAQKRVEQFRSFLKKINLITSEGDEGAWRYKSYELKKWTPAQKVVSNSKHFGENGRGVILKKDKKELAKKTFEINNFNLVISDLIPLNRSLKDHREPECVQKKYPELLPTTSVIIVFNNEAWSTLLRNVWSIINRSPKELLKEIILVDDSSDHVHLKNQLDDYVSLLPVPVYVHHAENRTGLVRARLIGAKHAKGQVLTFLDGHCECSEGWLEPLLSRIAENRKVVIAPIIDVISPNDFSYTPKTLLKGGFNYKFEYTWLDLNNKERKKYLEDKTKPYPTAAIAGGLFSIDREYFYEIGAYDEGMDIWGSENIEMSIRVWQCGGLLETSFCSRVGHIFRKSPIVFPGDTNTIIYHNFKRLAEVWIDEWKHYIYALFPTVREVISGDVSSRKKLRKELQCKSFRWYLENIFPESPLLITPVYLGSISNTESNQCLFASPSKGDSDTLNIDKCSEATFQRFIITPQNEIRTSKHCLDGIKKDAVVRMYNCHGLKGNQEWFYNDKEKSIKHSSTQQCIQIFKENNQFMPVLRDCNSSNSLQKWTLKNDYEWKKYFNISKI